MKSFYEMLQILKDDFFLESRNKNILLLIHPDCVFELGVDNCIEYEEKVKNHYKKFDYIISHLFWPESMVNYIRNKRTKEESAALDKIINTIKFVSNVTTPQNGPDSCTYDQELPDYLIDNENVNIFMAGGYEDNCLWRAYIEMFKKLDFLIKEKNTSVLWYDPLIFRAKYHKTQSLPDEEVQFDRLNLKSVDPRPSTFDRRKVDYGEPIS